MYYMIKKKQKTKKCITKRIYIHIPDTCHKTKLNT